MWRFARLLALGAWFGLSSLAFGQTPENRSADEAAIKQHIESIFKAFIDHDVKKLRETHSEDWRGFLGGGHIVKGLEEYIKFSGVDSDTFTDFKFDDYDTIFYGPDIACVNYIAELISPSGTSKISVLDLYAKREGGWIQVGSYTAPHPDRLSSPVQLGDKSKDYLLATRDKVWKAWFGGDVTALGQLLSEDVIALEKDGIKHRKEILDDSKRFAASGAKLTKLEFPTTEVQTYGRTIVVYSTYEAEIELNGKKQTMKGRSTETFVLGSKGLVNVGWQLG